VATLVPALLRLFADVGALDPASAAMHQLSIRVQLSRLLAWLWEQPDHRERWQRLGAPGPRFLVFLCRDARVN
jgi:Ubiquitin elongating factor core